MALIIDGNFMEQFTMINTNNKKKTFEMLKNKIEYYPKITSSIMDHNTCLNDDELTAFG